MKVSYVSYRRLAAQYPELQNKSVIPGDDVEVDDKYASFFEESEVRTVAHQQDEEMLRLGAERVESRKKRQQKIRENIRSIQNEDEEEDNKKEKEKKEDFVLPLDDVTKSIVDYKISLKEKGLKRVEINRLVKEYKEQAVAEQEVEQIIQKADQPVESPKRGRRKKDEDEGEVVGQLVKDPVTGEFKRV